MIPGDELMGVVADGEDWCVPCAIQEYGIDATEDYAGNPIGTMFAMDEDICGTYCHKCGERLCKACGGDCYEEAENELATA